MLTSIKFLYQLQGIGPTVSLEASRPVGGQSSLFCKARGSILFGDSTTQLNAIEDEDLTPPPFNTTLSTSLDDLLSIGELQVGLRWHGRKSRHQSWTPYASAALEGQIWNGAGNSSSEEGNLGFFGLNAGAGIDW